MAKQITVYDVVTAIQQAAAQAYDGGVDQKGEPVKIGLKREEEHTIYDKRLIDGFGVKFSGNQLCIKYHSEVLLKDVQKNSFENDTVHYLDQIVKYLKSEYKTITGEALNLKMVDEPKLLVQSTSSVRYWVEAHCWYEIGNISKDVEAVGKESEDSVRDAIKDFLAINKPTYPKAKKPSNVTSKVS